ncbi:MAG: exo-alpha-sialidase [Prosthecobacter sp.]
MKVFFVFVAATACLCGSSYAAPDPASPDMLAGPWLPDNPHRLDFGRLPRVPSEHAMISDVRAVGSSVQSLDLKSGGVNQHNYLAHHDGRFWAMWSDGPGIEDRVGQRVKFAISKDGLTWSRPEFLTPIPPNSGPDSPHYGTRTDKGMRWIARGFWKRDGELLALASLDEAAGFFGKSLELRAFRFDRADAEWRDAGVVYKNAINNFPPLKLQTGDWMMSRRMFDYKTSGVHFLVGGVKSLDDWESFPVLGSASELKAEEPDWWILPDNHLAAVFRDNRRSGFLYRAFSTDNGRTWSKPVKTNFPDATSKVSGLRLNDGRYVLVSNPNPKKRDPLTLSISDDGIVFTKMLYLVGGRHIDYPHVIEHDGSLYIAFAGGKQSVEVLKVKLSDMDAVQMPAKQLLAPFESKPAANVTDWIDLGNEGETLYLVAELTVPKRGQTAKLGLGTSSGLERVVVGVDAAGILTARIQPGEAKGPELKEGETMSLLVRIVGHQTTPDELFVQTGPAGGIPAEPKDGAWTLSNSKGNTQANLAVATTTSQAFKNVRVASSRATLAKAKPVKTASAKASTAHDLSPPHPVTNPKSALMLAGEGIPADTHRIDFKNLPRIPSQHAVISDVLAQNGHRVNQHNYLVHHDGRYWAMWSDGPGVSNGYGKVPHHDQADQHVSFATSEDGLKWSAIGDICGAPDAGYGWIARGFWMREGKLLALASRYKAPGYAGDGLSLHAFEVVPGDKPAWKHLGLLADNSMNNFPPKQLPSGEWLMTRRDQNQAVHFMRGGVTAFDDWTSVPVVSYKSDGLAAEEPYWWALPDGHLCALFRDNNKSGFLYRAFSTDEGRTWTRPVQTNFPDAASKFSGVRLQDGRYVLVSNSNPMMRDPLTLALSNDGLVFHSLGYLVGGRHIDYPHVIEHDGFVLVAFATAKQTVEVLKIRIADL